MKPIFVILALFGYANSATAGATDEGTVLSTDGKGNFRVATRNNGVIDFQASKEILGDKPEPNFPAWPHVYKDLQKGDHVKLLWGKDKKSGKTIAEGLRIIKRGG